MSDPRYVKARVEYVKRRELVRIPLPDAEHIHVTRHPDGTITAVPMRRCTWGDLWVDCPTGGDQ